jgi:hypothetical protein
MIDEDAQIVSRIPKSEIPVHDKVSYDELGAPEPFDEIHEIDFYGAKVLRIFLSSGKFAQSGTIISVKEG